MPGEVDDDEQQVSDLVLEPLTPVFTVVRGNDLFHFTHFFLKFVEYTFDIRPVKADASRPRRNLVGFVNRGQLTRNAFEQRSLFRRPALQLLGFFLRLYSFPVFDDLLGCRCRFAAENMRVPAYEFAGNLIDDGVDIEAARFPGELSVKQNMQENIAELFGEPLEVIIFDRLEHFIDFLDEHRLKRIEVLLLVPWTAIRTAQRRHDFDKFFELWPGLRVHNLIIGGVLHS